MKTPELSIIIVNYNSIAYLLKCIRSIQEQYPQVNYEVIVVDNASDDGCGKILSREYPDVIFFQSRANLGFARANNLGAKHAKGEVLLFLNPDTEISGKAISILYNRIKTLKNPGALGCKLLNTDGTLQTSCVQALPSLLNHALDAEVLRRLFPLSKLWGNAVLFRNLSSPAQVEAVSGACLMITRRAFQDVGGFSTDYFMYGEDLDLCYKTLQAGFFNYYVPEAVVVHHGGGSTNRSQSPFSIVMMRESKSRFFAKHYGRRYGMLYRLTMEYVSIIRIVLTATLFPFYLLHKRLDVWHAVMQKWVYIFRWGLGLEKWVLKYDRNARNGYVL